MKGKSWALSTPTEREQRESITMIGENCLKHLIHPQTFVSCSLECRRQDCFHSCCFPLLSAGDRVTSGILQTGVLCPVQTGQTGVGGAQQPGQ